MNQRKRSDDAARRPRLLACDIDGTLLEDGAPTAGLEELRVRLQSAEPSLRLVYATGRTYPSVQSLVRQGILPPPDAVAAQVGTELWLPPWRRPLARYEDTLTEAWNADAARRALARAPGATLQESCYQTRLKASAYVAPEARLRVHRAVQAALRLSGLRARFVYSGDRYLDVLPARSGKGAALRFLSELWPDTDPIVACGDSGNDADMLTDPRTRGVIVGNARDERLAHLRSLPGVYRARRSHAAGVLEGAAACGLFGRRPRARRRASRWWITAAISFHRRERDEGAPKDRSGHRSRATSGR